MSTPIKRIEKDFLLKVLYDEVIPIMYIKGQTQYVLTVEKPTTAEMYFKSDRPIDGLKPRKKIELMFDFRGQVVSFSAEVSSVKDDHITAISPEYLYKNLDRSFSRVSTPEDLIVLFSFNGDRYSLSYPKVSEFETGEPGELIKTMDPKNLAGLIGQLEAWIKNYSSGYKMVIFKDVKPSVIEEHLIAETGKSIFITSTAGNFPLDDPHPKKRIITEDIFKRYQESTGVDPAFLNDTCTRFLKQKREGGILSDLWTPILFQEYVIGYIHTWISKEGLAPFDYSIIEQLYQFAKILAYSLKINGYFDAGKLKNDPFDGKIIDISASGLLFAYPNSTFASALMPDSELAVQLKTPRRAVKTNAKIVRRYKDSTQGYFGLRFMNMAPEDLRFLFEYIYGKHFTDKDATFLSGQV